MARHTEIDMINGPITGKLIRFALPLMFSGMLQLLFNAADVVVVGQFCGSTSLAAVGSNGAVINLLVTLFIGISVGTNVLVARYLGRRQYDAIHRAVHSSILFSVIIGIFIGIVGAILAPQLLHLINVPDDVLPLASLYLRIYFIGIPATVVYNFGAAILRASGDTKHPMYYLIVAGATNLTFNVFFVVGCHWDVAGVAAATAFSQYIAAFLVIRCLTLKDTSCRLELKKLRIYKFEMLEMIRIGIPAGLQSTIFSISNVLIQSSINSFGSIVIAGNSAASNIENFIGIATNSIHHAGVSFISQNLGAGKSDRVRRIAINCYVLVFLVGTALSVAVYLLGRPLLGIFTPDPVVIEAGMIRITWVGLSHMLCGAVDVACGLVRGLGRSWLPMIVTLVGACLFRIIWIFTVFASFPTLEILYAAYPITWALTLIAHTVCIITLIRKLFQSMPPKKATPAPTSDSSAQ